MDIVVIGADAQEVIAKMVWNIWEYAAQFWLDGETRQDVCALIGDIGNRLERK
jgi:glucose dehydrogenase